MNSIKETIQKVKNKIENLQNEIKDLQKYLQEIENPKEFSCNIVINNEYSAILCEIKHTDIHFKIPIYDLAYSIDKTIEQIIIDEINFLICEDYKIKVNKLNCSHSALFDIAILYLYELWNCDALTHYKQIQDLLKGVE